VNVRVTMKIAEQIAEQQLGPELDKEKREQVPLQQRQREAQEKLRHEGAKLADNDNAVDKTTSGLAQSQREPGEPLNFNFGEVTGGVSASAGSSSVATGSLSPAGFFKSDTPEELRYKAEKLADNDQGAKVTSWRTQYQREKIEVAADTHMVGSRRSTLLYGDHNENEMIEGRPVYESTKVSEVLADASGGSGTEGGDSGERLHFNFGEVVTDDMQSKPFSGFIAELETEVSSSAGEVAVVAQEEAMVARVVAAYRAALRTEREEQQSVWREVPGLIVQLRVPTLVA
jgi:hypothetical protein